jgi:hypothetical protein
MIEQPQTIKYYRIWVTRKNGLNGWLLEGAHDVGRGYLLTPTRVFSDHADTPKQPIKPAEYSFEPLARIQAHILQYGENGDNLDSASRYKVCGPFYKKRYDNEVERKNND